MKTTTTYRYPDAEEIKSYISGEMDPQRAHEIEALALDDPFLADALDGYNAIPAFDEIPHPPSGVPSSGTPWWHLAGWGIGLTVGVILAVMVYKTNTPEKTQPHHTPALTAQEVEIEEQSEEPGNMGVAEANPSYTETKPRPVNARPDNQSNPNVYADPVELPTPSDIKVIERTNAGQVLLDVRTQDPALKKSSYGDGANLLHWRNYKLIDYSQVRKKQWPDFEGQSSHTPASQENPETGTDMLRTETIQSIPYIDYLDKCIDAFRNGDFNSAAAHFDIILAQYPDDLNGQFYGAMSNYHLGEYEKAIKLFDQSLNNVFKTFREESEFYKAMSLSKLNRTSEAAELFTRIAAGNGFYAQRAAQELK